jgi:hypothetical protein
MKMILTRRRILRILPIEENVMDFDEWMDENYDDLIIECAEIGADQELDFDFQRFCEDRHFSLLNRMKENSTS